MVPRFVRSVAPAVAAVVLAACGAGEAPQPARLVIAQPQEPQSLDPLFLTGSNTATIAPLIYSYLLTLDERGRLQPDVALAVPTVANGGISRDGLTITYHLRPGVRWQDGAPLTARDVAFTYGAIVNPANNVPSRSGYDHVARVDALDDATVRVRLRRRYAPILSSFLAPDQNYPILPSHLLAKYPDLNQVAFNREPIGSGPYRAAEWVRGNHLRLVRNETYYRGAPAIPEIDLTFVSDSNTIVNQLRTGEITADLVADPAHLAEYGAIARARVVRAPLDGIGDLFFNVRDPDLADVRLRRALVEGADLPRVVRNATKGAQTTQDAQRGIFGWGYDPSIAMPRTNVADAARLLDAAGWSRRGDGTRAKGGRPLSLQFSFVSGNAPASAIGIQLQQQLATLGVQLLLRSYAPAQFRAPASSGGPLFGGTFQIAFLEIYTPADADTGWYLGCAEIPPAGFNLSRFCDAATDRAEAAGVATYDVSARRRSSAIVQRRVVEQLPFVALWQQNAVYVIPAGLRGFHPAAQSPLWNVGSWSLDPASGRT
jgi:peptide/nickel transport system substrate-binding protein